MKVSREQVAENRHRILDVASRLFRERGYEAVTIAEVMKVAGLTHGGFYVYFKSKEDLIACALKHVFAQDDEAVREPLAYAARYLLPEHRDDLSGGCPTAALAAETVRQTSQARAAMTEGQRQILERFIKGLPNLSAAEARRTAIASWSAMVGAMVLSRLVDDTALSDEFLSQTSAWIQEKTA